MKIAWITGAGSGIGEACAIGLAQDGYTVVLSGRREAPLADVAGRIAAAGGNLSSAFYCSIAVLPMMRAQGGGLLLHTASMAGRFVSPLSGAGYTATKHGVVAMSHSINMEECGHGIRSTVMCPGEVSTPILDKRPNKLSAEQRAEMVQPEDCAALVRFVAGMPPHVCINEVLITPTRNRAYLAAMERKL